MNAKTKSQILGPVAAAIALVFTAVVQPDAAAQDEVVTGQGRPGQTYDSDWDGLDDATESYYGMNPYSWDMDGDGLGDGDEFFDRYALSDPTLYDTDGDWLGDGYEVFSLGTDPMLPDTDLDGWFDNVDAQPLNPLRH